MAITKLTSPRQSDSADCVPVKWGGTGSRTKAGAQRNLELLVASQADQPNQHGNLDENRLVPVNLFPPGMGSGVVPFLFGPETVKAGEDFFVYITNYDSFTTYVLDKGNTEAAYTVRQQKNMVFFEANGDNVGTFNFSVNGRDYQFVSEPNNFQYNLVISTLVKNFNLRTALIAAGWDTTTPVDATVTVTNTGVVGSTSINSPSFDTGTGYPEGSLLSLIVNGYIAGKGGNGGTIAGTVDSSTGVIQSESIVRTPGQTGGDALKTSFQTVLSGSGVIGGGGGGGAGGFGSNNDSGRYISSYIPDGEGSIPVYSFHSSGGGAGAGSDVGIAGTSYGDGVRGGNATLTAGGSSGSVPTFGSADNGGGSLGQAGGSGHGTSNSVGEALAGGAGRAVVGFSYVSNAGFTGSLLGATV